MCSFLTEDLSYVFSSVAYAYIGNSRVFVAIWLSCDCGGITKMKTGPARLSNRPATWCSPRLLRFRRWKDSPKHRHRRANRCGKGREGGPLRPLRRRLAWSRLSKRPTNWRGAGGQIKTVRFADHGIFRNAQASANFSSRQALRPQCAQPHNCLICPLHIVALPNAYTTYSSFAEAGPQDFVKSNDSFSVENFK